MNEALELANNKIDELYIRLSESERKLSEKELTIKKVASILESGMSTSQKIIYIEKEVK